METQKPTISAFENLSAYYGDLHNHCAIGYGHGSIEDSFKNARLQLDFACVTVHAHWPDIPVDETRLAPVVEYHRKGFEIAGDNWPYLQEVVEDNNEPGKFVSFLGFEWHSREYGDHNVYFNRSQGEIIRAVDLEHMRAVLRAYKKQGIDTMLIPHHIGYKQGYRGINWQTFTSEFSPVVEIMSMHGASESPDAPYPYLHTMGPRDWQSTYQYGLAQANIVGVMGSTDHHSAHPGSYGHGRIGVWAKNLSREAIWEAINMRRTFALTGDNIKLAFSINGKPVGTVLSNTLKRQIEVMVEGGSAIDYVEVLHNNRIIHRVNAFEQQDSNLTNQFTRPFKIHLEVGWGEKGKNVDWQVELEVVNGKLLGIEPRFRGHEIVSPQAREEETYAFSQWEQRGKNGVWFTTRTWGNSTTTTASPQGICLEVLGDDNTRIRGQVKGQAVDVPLIDLLHGPQAAYLHGFLTPAYYFHRAVPSSDYTCQFNFVHKSDSKTRDWYYLRVRQVNGQWAWSSPIWIEA